MLRISGFQHFLASGTFCMIVHLKLLKTSYNLHRKISVRSCKSCCNVVISQMLDLKEKMEHICKNPTKHWLRNPDQNNRDNFFEKQKVEI